MSGVSYHRCPVEVAGQRCAEQVSRSMIMCRRHWYSVPKALRDQLWDAYRNESDAYWEAREAVIEAAERRAREEAVG